MSKQHHKKKQQSNILNNSQNTQERHAPSYHDIEMLAFQIHEERGGADLDNWLEAERLLKEQHCLDKC